MSFSLLSGVAVGAKGTDADLLSNKALTCKGVGPLQ